MSSGPRRRIATVRDHLRQPFPAARLTNGRLYAVGLAIGMTFAVAITIGGLALDKVASEAQQRAESDRRSEADIERIVKRVVRVEGVRDLARSLERTCRRFPTCAAELDRAQRQERVEAERRERRRRRDGDPDRAPEQRADRPPRQPSTPAPQPEPVTGPPPPPGRSVPPTPTASSPAAPSPPATPDVPRAPSAPPAAPVVQVDVPPVDLDDDQGLLPELLPRVNVAPADVPPIRLP